MDNEGLYISSAIMDKYSTMANESSSKLDNTKESSSKGFSSLINNNIYSKGFSKINNRLSLVSDTIKNTNSVNKTYINRFIDLENDGKKTAESIKVPKIDNTRSTLLLETYYGKTLSKDDGKSVNEGIEEVKEEKLEEYSILKDELLKDINNYYEGLVLSDDDYTTITKKIIENVNNKINSMNIEFIDYYDIKQEIISKINNELNTLEIKMNEINLEEVDLSKIDKLTEDHIVELNDYINTNNIDLDGLGRGE